MRTAVLAALAALAALAVLAAPRAWAGDGRIVPVAGEEGAGFEADDTDLGTLVRSECTVVPPARGTVWVVRGTIVTSDVVIDDGVVVFDTRDGLVDCVGTDEQCKVPGKAGIIECSSSVVFPGLVDIHNHPEWATLPRMYISEHVFSRRYEWRGWEDYRLFTAPRPDVPCLNTAFAELKGMLGGTTAMQGPPAVEACHHGLVRNLFGEAHGLGEDQAPPHTCYQLDMAGDDGRPDDRCRDGASIHLHVGEGVDRFSQHEFAMAEYAGYNRPGLIAINTLALDTWDLGRLAVGGGGLVWSPRNGIHFYRATADILTARNLGVPVALSPDWPITGGVNLLSELRCADQLNRGYLGGALDDAELVRKVTSAPADMIGLGEGGQRALGRLDTGYRADLIIVAGDTRQPYRVLIEATPHEVLGTFVDGQVLQGQRDLVEGIRGAGHGCDALDVYAPNVGAFSHLVCLADGAYEWDLDGMLDQVLASYEGRTYGGHPTLSLYQSVDVIGTLRPYRSGNVWELITDDRSWTPGQTRTDNPVPYAEVPWRAARTGGYDDHGLPAFHRYESVQVDLGRLCVRSVVVAQGRAQSLEAAACDAPAAAATASVSFYLFEEQLRPVSGVYEPGDTVDVRGILGYHRGVMLYPVSSRDVRLVPPDVAAPRVTGGPGDVAGEDAGPGGAESPSW